MEEQQSLEIANFRYRLIAPIVSRIDLPPGQIQALIGEAARKTYQIPYSNRTTVSVCSIERYLQAYREEGFEGRKPKVREGRQRRIPEEYLKLTTLLKKENPHRSCEQIIRTLELSGKVPAGVLKRSTVYDYLDKCELTRRHLRKEHKAYQRYQTRHRNQRWLGDTCHLMHLPNPEQAGKKKKVYLICWMDDYSRLVTHGQCYWAEKLPMLEDSLKKAMMKYGLPTQIYVDNGKIYSSNYLDAVCGKLGIMRSRSRPYQPAGKVTMARGDGSYPKFMSRLANFHLLRCHKRSTILASQLPLEHWHETMTDLTVADAVLDRLFHTAHKIKLKGESMRKLKS